MKRESLFRRSVLQVVRMIPSGEVLSYSEVALRAGFPGAARAVGTLMKENHNPSVPCHRVIRSDGRVGEYNAGGSATKEARLRREGVLFSSNGRAILMQKRTKI